MIKFIYKRPEIHSPYSAVNKVEMVLDDEASLPQMLEAYKEFLRSIGFGINGELDVVEPDDEWKGQEDD